MTPASALDAYREARGHGRASGLGSGSSHVPHSDVLDDLAEAALRTGGEVIVPEAARMPSKTGAAAVFRY